MGWFAGGTAVETHLKRVRIVIFLRAPGTREHIVFTPHDRLAVVHPETEVNTLDVLDLEVQNHVVASYVASWTTIRGVVDPVEDNL